MTRLLAILSIHPMKFRLYYIRHTRMCEWCMFILHQLVFYPPPLPIYSQRFHLIFSSRRSLYRLRWSGVTHTSTRAREQEETRVWVATRRMKRASASPRWRPAESLADSAGAAGSTTASIGVDVLILGNTRSCSVSLGTRSVMESLAAQSAEAMTPSTPSPRSRFVLLMLY